MSWRNQQELRAAGVQAHDDAKVSREAWFYGGGRVRIGAGARIDHGCLLMGDIEIGERVHLAPYCVLYGKAGIRIGAYSGFGACTVMHTESDDYSGGSMFGPCVPDAYQPGKQRAAIVIGAGVLGGTRVTILPGVTIGDGAAIGAHALVKDACEPGWLYAGTPARRVRQQRQDIWRLMREFESSLG